MLVSIKNLKQFISLEGLSPKEIADRLTFSGVEVEEVVTLASGTDLVIGEIVECLPHPDSDHLHVLKVDMGAKYGVSQIVCGAPNARLGLKVIVARVGAKLPQIEIKEAKIRGIPSSGMCCSLLELGVDSKYLSKAQLEGIEELPADAPVGEEKVLEYIGYDDVIFNLKILANRPDLLSVFNIARELGAIFSRPVSIPEVEPMANFETELNVGSATKACTQFAGKEIRGIVTQKSPVWLQEQLSGLGIRSINNIVDIGNYVMMMTGQPLHMYDADKLKKKELIARDDYQGSFVALDEKTYEIIPGDIVISCDKQPKCLGGVMGALECAVDEKTKNIYIEAASFKGASIRHTSNRLGLVSESSSRFVKGTNHFQAAFVLEYATKLLREIGGAKHYSNVVEYQSEEQKDQRIISDVKNINARLGTTFTGKQIKEALERLHFQVMLNVTGYFIAVVPAWRLDIVSEADLSEEVIRLLGYNNVHSILPKLDAKVGILTAPQQRLRQVRYFLLDRGLDECLTYSLISKKEKDAFNLLNQEDHYVIMNPLTDEHEVMRTHVVHSLLKAASFNAARQNKNLAFFEVSNVESKSSRSDHLAIVLLGCDEQRSLLEKIPYDFYHIKGIVDQLMSLLGIELSRYRYQKLANHLDELHPGKSAAIVFQNQIVGVLGELHPQKIEEYGFGKSNAAVLELNLSTLLDAKVNGLKMTPLSRFPSIERDLAFVIDGHIEAKDIVKTIKIIGQGLVSDALIFDVYAGKGIPEGQKSIAVKVICRSDDHTLTDREVSDTLNKIKAELTRAYKAELRS